MRSMPWVFRGYEGIPDKTYKILNLKLTKKKTYLHGGMRLGYGRTRGAGGQRLGRILAVGDQLAIDPAQGIQLVPRS